MRFYLSYLWRCT